MIDPNGVRAHIGHCIGVTSMTSIWKSVGNAVAIGVQMSVDIPFSSMKFPVREAIRIATLDR